MRTLTLVLCVLVTMALVGSAVAVGPGKTVEYAGGKEGKVVFKGDTHKVNKCMECHPKTFGPMAPHKERMKAPMKDGAHEAGAFCGSCHDGTKKAFAQEGNCNKCHMKAAGGY